MSRLRSARGASRPAGRGSAPAARPGQRGVFVQAPKSDVYVALLGVALGAILLGCLFLILLLNRYEFKTKAAALPAPMPALAGLSGSSEILSTVRL